MRWALLKTTTCGGQIASLLSALNDTDECPKTIIYSLNPADNEQIGTILGCFQSSEVPGKIQHGSAWWFNDQKIGMENQMKSLANLGLLGNFVGMLTDSRMSPALNDGTSASVLGHICSLTSLMIASLFIVATIFVFRIRHSRCAGATIQVLCL